MKHLAKFLLAVLLLTVTAVSWGACPEGQKQTYKGCEVDATPKMPNEDGVDVTPF